MTRHLMKYLSLKENEKKIFASIANYDKTINECLYLTLTGTVSDLALVATVYLAIERLICEEYQDDLYLTHILKELQYLYFYAYI